MSTDWLDELTEYFVGCISSPWGEGATYHKDNYQAAVDEGLENPGTD